MLRHTLPRISSRCYRLVSLISEIQNDVQVVKPIVQELEILRLSCALGMSTSVDLNDFNGDMLEAQEFDEDFIRFLQQHVLTNDRIRVVSLFGKQDQIQAHLQQLQVWDQDMEQHLQGMDNGIFGVLTHQAQGDFGFILFGWIQDYWFQPSRIRDTATYIVRFLTCLSTHLTCCLSSEDTSAMERMVIGISQSKGDRWKSYSVAFRVEQQIDQQDNVHTRLLRTNQILPSKPNSIETFMLKGSFPAVAIVGSTPSRREKQKKRQRFDSANKFSKFLMCQSTKFAMRVKIKGELTYDFMNDFVKALGLYPHDKMKKIEEEYDRSIHLMKEQCDEEVQAIVASYREVLYKAASQVFRADILVNTDENVEALHVLNNYLNKLHGNKNLVSFLDEETIIILHLHNRLKTHVYALNRLIEADMKPEFNQMIKQIMKRKNWDIQDLSQSTTSWMNRTMQLGKRILTSPTISPKFRTFMEMPLELMKTQWISAIDHVLELYAQNERVVLERSKLKSIQRTSELDKQAAVDNVVKRTMNEWAANPHHDLWCNIWIELKDNMIQCHWTEEHYLPQGNEMSVWKMDDEMMQLLGTTPLHKDERILQVFTIQHSNLLVVSVNHTSTIIRCVRFKNEHILKELRRVATHCDFNAKERSIAFADDRGVIALYRINEIFSSMEQVRTLELCAKTSLELPLKSLLISGGFLHVMDHTGAMQSVNTRSQQVSRKCSALIGQNETKWCSGLFSVLGGIAIGSFNVHVEGCGTNGVFKIISSEDNRVLPQSPIVSIPLSSVKGLSMAVFNDLVYVVDQEKKCFHVVKLEVTMQSDSFRIRTVNELETQTNVEQDTENRLANHWLWVLYHVFEKFPVRGLLDEPVLSSHLLRLRLVCDSNGLDGMRQAARTYMGHIMSSLLRLNKPLLGLDLADRLEVLVNGRMNIPDVNTQSITAFVQQLITFVPIQICRAEKNTLTVMTNGQDKSDEMLFQSTVQSADIARSIRFGLFSPFLQSWLGSCIVITSMGKQSTGKSYYLNHLTGSSFAIAGARCTDGAWMTFRILGSTLLIVIDFEGLGSFERTEQEDVFLSILNASISNLTIFRLEMRLDKEIDLLFTKFQKGCQLLQSDPHLFCGKLFMSVKDVNPNDQQGVVDEFVSKFGKLLTANRQQNFLTEMYNGELDINCSPPLGTEAYYQSLNHIQTFIKYQLCNSKNGFLNGKEFLNCIRLVLAKISILDWTSLDDSALQLKVAEMGTQLYGVIRYGAFVRGKSLDQEPLTYPKSGALIEVTLDEMCEIYSQMAVNWCSLNDLLNLDSIAEEDIDLGDIFIEAKRIASISSKILEFFSLYRTKMILKTQKLTLEHQKSFDVFLSFLIRRRRSRVQKWTRAVFGECIPESWMTMEQQALSIVQTAFVRCLGQCQHCQLGCMQASMHSVNQVHNCGTSHHCPGRCEYCDVFEIASCQKPAGHDGKCECSLNHTCGAPCHLQHAANCGQTCGKKTDHEGDHRCSVGLHKCGQACLAKKCAGHCILDIETSHIVHKCDIGRCLEPCVMSGCDHTCNSDDHFHGQTEVHVAHSIDQPGCTNTFDASSIVPVIHMCGEEHNCEALCEENGICDVKVFLKLSSRTFAGKRGTFDYTFQEMNGSRKKCQIKLLPGQQTHQGQHTCLGEVNDTSIRHYCDVRCPCCSYYCQKEFGHDGLHRTPHGNMQNTAFISEDNDFDIEDRKYTAGDSGTAEMCNLYCSKMGRGHVHFIDCDRDSNSNHCVYTGSEEDKRRHCTRSLHPKPDHEVDEILHDRFWETHGWEDPCTSAQEREDFSKCGYKCDAPEHDDKKTSYCTLKAWHAPVDKPSTGYDGFSYVAGHQFECNHTANGSTMHHVFVLDCSGSMSGQPWEDLMSAYREYINNRITMGATLDLVSMITFDHSACVEYEGSNVTSMTNPSIFFRGGGTSYASGLRSANELISRIDFSTYKPVIVFFSDGQPCDGREGELLGRHLHESYGMYGLEAFSVGFGNVNLSVLERVAKEMGGTYHRVLTGEELKTKFYTISVSVGTRTGLMLVKPDPEPVCVICQKDLVSEERVSLHPCHHELHKSCHLRLTANAKNETMLCPICRKSVRV